MVACSRLRLFRSTARVPGRATGAVMEEGGVHHSDGALDPPPSTLS